MWRIIVLLTIALAAFLFVAKETPSSLISRLGVIFNGTYYAQQVFEGRVEVERILASEPGHPAKSGEPECRVALATLPADAPQRPPRIPVIEQDSRRFGGNWKPSPVPSGMPLAVDVLAVCAEFLDGPSRPKLEQAVAEPGAFVIRDWKNDTLQIYSKKFGLVAHLAYR